MTTQSLPKDRHITYRIEYRTCGKPTCRCRRGALHGPYRYGYAKLDDGKLHGFYLGRVRQEEDKEMP